MDAKPNAVDIATTLITMTGQSLMLGDFETFKKCFGFPLKIETILGTNIINAEEKLRDSFHNIRAHYRRLGVQNMERECVSAEFKSADTIRCIHETRLFVASGVEQHPFTVDSILTRREDGWVVTDSNYSISDSLSYVRALTQ